MPGLKLRTCVLFSFLLDFKLLKDLLRPFGSNRRRWPESLLIHRVDHFPVYPHNLQRVQGVCFLDGIFYVTFRTREPPKLLSFLNRQPGNMNLW
jgi:hypothetical protein